MIRKILFRKGCFFQLRNTKSISINSTSLFSSDSVGKSDNVDTFVSEGAKTDNEVFESSKNDEDSKKCTSADDMIAAKDYYDRYYKMFSTLPHPSDSERNIKNNYYDDYYKLFSSDGVGLENIQGSHLTHVNEKGEINMVDVGHKSDTIRIAIARSTVKLGKKAFELVKQNQVEKGDVLSTAKIAGIMAAKNTSNMIPLCHPLALSKVAVDMEFVDQEDSLYITSEVHTSGKTGVEMEALVSVSVASLTVYDMCKAVTKDITISDVQLVHKSGGKSGDYWRQ